MENVVHISALVLAQFLTQKICFLLPTYKLNYCLVSLAFKSGFDLHNYNWFHYGYPHLTKTLRGEELRSLLVVAREKSLLTSIDVNGANDDVSAIEPAMPYTVILRMV